MNQTLITRIASALVGVSVLAGVAILLKAMGLIVLCIAVNTIVIYEYARILHSHNKIQQSLCWLFAIACFDLVIVGTFQPQWAQAAFGTLLTLLVAVTLISAVRQDDVKALLTQMMMLILGLVYCGLFPTLVTSLLVLGRGQLWFLTFLTVVFAGDTSAYFSGKLFGRGRVLPLISPGKTWIGSIGGLAGSLLAMIVIRNFFFTDLPFYWLLGLTVLTSVLAQAGDFFESLIKRVASVKDSGSFMPGHGGLMDRVDGVYFAAPIFYTAASYIETLSQI